MSFGRRHEDEAGQALVEYVLTLALVAFAATRGILRFANSVNAGFTALARALGTHLR